MGLPLRVTDLTVRTRRGRVILKVPALEVAEGQSLGIQGPSGAGKSTLLFALAGLLSDASGAVDWGSVNILDLSADRRAAFRANHIGLIFQDFLLFEELSSVVNATLPALFLPRSKRPALRKRALDHLDRMGIVERKRRVADFSGGERQRVAIARALANDTGILLADEPTASLDRDTADLLVTDLTDMAQSEGKTFIAVSHDSALLKKMDRVITMRDGVLFDDLTRPE